jgi:hypothetical protein
VLLRRIRPKGEFLQFVANYGFGSNYQTYLESHPIPMDHGSLTGRTMLECKTVHIHDVLADPDWAVHDPERSSAASVSRTAACHDLMLINRLCWDPG